MNAGDAAFAFALPQPTVNYIPEGGTTYSIEGSISLPAAWVDGGGAAFLRKLTISSEGRIGMELADTANGDGSLAGPQLLSSVRDRLVLEIEYQGTTVRVAGIGSTTEPYEWTPSNPAPLVAFFNSYVSGSAVSVTLTIPQSDFFFVTPQDSADAGRVFDSLSSDGAMGGIGIVGSETLPCLVSQVRAYNDLSAQLLLVPRANDIHDAETGPIPPYDPRITIPTSDSEFAARILSDAIDTARATNGRDGKGFEVVFIRTIDSTPPLTPDTTTAQREMDEYIPPGWTDNPQGPTELMPFEWVIIRIGTAGAWGPFQPVPNASLWARYGSVTHDIGSDSTPAVSLGQVGDTAINDDGLYFLKTATGWVLRGDLTEGDAQVYFRDTMPPPNSFGEDNDVAIGPNNRLMRRVNGTWVDISLAIPTPTGLSATVTALYLGRLPDNAFHSYDLLAEWTAPGTGYLVEIDIGHAPISLDGADSVWGDVLSQKSLQLRATSSPGFQRTSHLTRPARLRQCVFAIAGRSHKPACGPTYTSISTQANLPWPPQSRKTRT